MRLFYLIAVCCAVMGCATVIRGTESTVQFESTPSGAQVSTQIIDICSISECAPIQQDPGQPEIPRIIRPPVHGPGCTTPCSIRVSRKDSLVATFTKDGYAPQTVNIPVRLAGEGAAGVAGNVLIGGVIGLGVDAATGAALEHFPNPVNVTLTAHARPAQKKKR
jgi:hypothetical protein